MNITLFEKEMEIEFMELHQLYSRMNSPLFLEDGEKKEGIISTIITKIKTILGKCKKAILNVFSSNKMKEDEQAVDDAFSKNPSLRNQQVQMTNFQELDKLNQQTLNELNSSKNPGAVVDNYKKKRNAILAGGAVAMGIGAALLFLRKKAKNANAEISNIEKATEQAGSQAKQQSANQEYINKLSAMEQIASCSTSDNINACKTYNEYMKKAKELALDVMEQRYQYKRTGSQEDKEKLDKLEAKQKKFDQDNAVHRPKEEPKKKGILGMFGAKESAYDIADQYIDKLMNEEVMEEGANADIHKLHKEHITSAKKKLKLAKKYIKEGDKQKARKVLQDVIKEMETVKKILKDGAKDDTSFEKTIGSFIGYWKGLASTLIMILGVVGISAAEVGCPIIFGIAGTVGIGAGLAGSTIDTTITGKKESEGLRKMLNLKTNTNAQNLSLAVLEVNSYRSINYQIADEVIICSKRLLKEIDNIDKFK